MNNRRNTFYILVSYFSFISIQAFSQTNVINTGTEITNAGTQIYINGSYVNGKSVKAKIANQGSFYIKSDFLNYAPHGVFETKRGQVVFNGNGIQNIKGDSSINFFKIVINNSGNDIVLHQNIKVRDSLSLLKGNVFLNGNNINLESTGYIYGEKNGNRIYGDSGVIKITKLLRETKLLENIGGLGIFISTRDNFGYTLIERGHKSQTFTGDTSVGRYYNFYPSNTASVDTLKILYFDKESTSNENFYKVFASFDGGIEWKNKGGFVNPSSNSIVSTSVSPPKIIRARFSIFPTQNFATCLPNDTNYISAVFLVSSTAMEGDSVKFVQLTKGDISGVTWNFGDGNISKEESPFHTYSHENDTEKKVYSITMTVTNGVCSDTRKKSIEVSPNPKNQRPENMFTGIEYVDLFPNPSSGSMNVIVKPTLLSDINIEIINSQGKSIHNITERSSSLNRQINVEDLATGVYYVKFRVSEDVRVLKMVKL